MNQRNKFFNIDIVMKSLEDMKQNDKEPFNKDIYETALYYLEDLKKYVKPIKVYKIVNNDFDTNTWWLAICDNDSFEENEFVIYDTDRNVNIKKGQYVKIIETYFEEMTSEKVKDYARIIRRKDV